MDEYKVLITTSGIGSRLGNLTKHTNKSLIRVGKKPALSYIIESYPDNVELIITVGYFTDHIKQFISLAYPDRKITFVEVDKYDGDGSSLGYSMLKAKDHLQCPFIFHASDSIVNDKIPSIDDLGNWIGVCKKENYSEYRTVNNNGYINEKGSFESDLVYIGVAGIGDYELFWNALEQLYIQDPNNKHLSDCNAINLIDSKINIVYFKNWLDVGNVVELNKSRELIKDKFNLLDKEDESIFLFDDFVIKFFANSEICDKRITRAFSLEGLVPQVVAYTHNFYKYEYATGDLLSHYVNESTIKELLSWSEENLWIPRESFDKNEFFKICEEFYFKKTEKRIKEFQSKNRLKDEELTINGRKIPPVLYLLNSIDKKWLCGEKPYQFHGDFILENILINNDSSKPFTLIDWRQDFGGSIYDGDIYYDLAKLNHNLIFSHDIVYKGLFHVHKRENVIECDILRSERLISCQEVFDSWILSGQYDWKKVKVLTALVWLNMSPLHDFKTGEFLYYFGIFNLFKSLCNLSYL